LAHGSGDILLNVGAAGAQGRDSENGQRGKADHAKLISPERRLKPIIQPPLRGLGAQDIIEDHFERPGFQQIGRTFPRDGHKANHQQLKMWAEQVAYFEALGCAGAFLHVHCIDARRRWNSTGTVKP
jgi:hypothetical protein